MPDAILAILSVLGVGVAIVVVFAVAMYLVSVADTAADRRERAERNRTMLRENRLRREGEDEVARIASNNDLAAHLDLVKARLMVLHADEAGEIRTLTVAEQDEFDRLLQVWTAGVRRLAYDPTR